MHPVVGDYHPQGYCSCAPQCQASNNKPSTSSRAKRLSTHSTLPSHCQASLATFRAIGLLTFLLVPGFVIRSSSLIVRPARCGTSLAVFNTIFVISDFRDVALVLQKSCFNFCSRHERPYRFDRACTAANRSATSLRIAIRRRASSAPKARSNEPVVRGMSEAPARRLRRDRLRALDNGVLAVPIRKRPQQICDAQTGDKINALLRKSLRLLPDRCAGYRYDPRCSKSNSP
jgi:hypothetical protein